MKIIACTAAVCLVIGASVFTTRKVVRHEARKTRNSMSGMLSNPLDDGESLATKLDKLNKTLESVNKRLNRLENITENEAKAENTELLNAVSGIKREIEKLASRTDNLARQQAALNDIPRHLRIIDANMRNAIGAIDSRAQANNDPPEEFLKAMDWMVQKIDDIDGYFPPLYNFLGAVYDRDATTTANYPSLDLRINEIILMLRKAQEDAAEIRNLVTPNIIEPKKHPRPFEGEN